MGVGWEGGGKRGEDGRDPGREAGRQEERGLKGRGVRVGVGGEGVRVR